MKTRRWLPLVMFLGACISNAASAQEIQHSDVFFVYGETQIEVAQQDDRHALPQLMPLGGFFAQANVNPGFFSEVDTGGGTGPNDIVGYNVLDDLIFWSEGDFATPREDTAIRIINNPRTVDDTVIGTGTGEQRATFDPLANSIGQSSGAGDFHSHVDFRLDPRSSDPDEMPLPGAYGIKLSLSSDNLNIQESDPFFIVYRFGMDDDAQFATALDDFDALLNEIPPGILGDFDSDGLLTAIDIDLLSDEVTANTNQAVFDLTGDAIVDQADRQMWVEDLAGSFFGDANLDGTVEFPDFLALSAGFGMPGGWAEGDFDGNGEVEFPDFLTLSASFGQTAAATASVPEPATKAFALAIPLAMLLVRRRTRVTTIRKTT